MLFASTLLIYTEMKSYVNFGLALLLTVVSLAVFAYCSFLGLAFRLRGNLLMAGAVFVPVLVLLVAALALMIKSKARRNAREGRPRELLSIAVAFVVLGLGAVPCSQFFNIFRQQDRLAESVQEAVAAVSELDSSYNVYAHGRAERISDPQVRRSLERRLIPASYDEVAAQRHEWLASLSEASVWNVYTPTNVSELQAAAEVWNEEYRQMSSVIFVCEGRAVQPFSHTASIEKLAAFNREFTEFHAPEPEVVGGTLVCILFVLLCYIFTERPKTGGGR